MEILFQMKAWAKSAERNAGFPAGKFRGIPGIPASPAGASPNKDRRVAEYFFLSLRGTSGERTEERGNSSKPDSSPQPSPPSDEREGEVLVRPHSEMRPIAPTRLRFYVFGLPVHGLRYP